MKMIRHLFILLILLITLQLRAQNQHIITSSGFDYTPDTLQAYVGDTIIFNAGSTHPTLQVDEENYVQNNAVPLNDGFFYPDGSGELVLENPDTIYYVCTAHLEYNMKGIIVVNEFKPTDVGIINARNDWQVQKIEDKYYKIMNLTQESYHVRIYNSKGSLIRNYQVTGNHHFNIDNLENGLYILQLQNSKNRHTIKLVVN